MLFNCSFQNDTHRFLFSPIRVRHNCVGDVVRLAAHFIHLLSFEIIFLFLHRVACKELLVEALEAIPAYMVAFVVVVASGVTVILNFAFA